MDYDSRKEDNHLEDVFDDEDDEYVESYFDFWARWQDRMSEGHDWADEDLHVTPRQWFQRLDLQRAALIKRMLRKGWENLAITPCIFYCLATDASLRERLEMAIKSRVFNRITFSWDAFTETLDGLRRIGLTIYLEALHECAVFLGNAMRKYPDGVSDFYISGYNSDNIHLTTTVLGRSGCIRKLIIAGKIHMNDDMEPVRNPLTDAQITLLQTAITNNPNVDSITFSSFTGPLLEMLGRILPSANVSYIVLYGHGSGLGSAPLHLTTPEEGNAIRQLLLIPTLKSIQLNQMVFDTLETINSVLPGFLSSRKVPLLTLKIADITFPEGSTALVAEALARCQVNELQFSRCTTNDAIFLQALGQAMVLPTCATRELRLGSRQDYIDCASVACFLRNNIHRRLEVLSMHLLDWDDRFDAVMANYVRTSERLFSLALDLCKSYQKAIFSEALIDAAASGTRCLRGFHGTNYWNPLVAGKRFTANFCNCMRHITMINGMHAWAAPILAKEQPASVSTFIRVLCNMELGHLFEFLRRNQLGLQALLQHFGSPRKALHVDKHTRQKRRRK